MAAPLVWAKLEGFPWWPACVAAEAEGSVTVLFYGEKLRKTALLSAGMVEPFSADDTRCVRRSPSRAPLARPACVTGARDARSFAYGRCTSVKKLKRSQQPKFRKAVDEAKAAAVAAEAAAARAAIAAVAQAERKESLRAERAVRVLDVAAHEPAPRKRARDGAGGGAASVAETEAAAAEEEEAAEAAEAAAASSTEHKCVRLKPPAQYGAEAMGEASAEAASQRYAIQPGQKEKRIGQGSSERERKSLLLDELRAFLCDRYVADDDAIDGWDVEIIRQSLGHRRDYRRDIAEMSPSGDVEIIW